MLVPNLRLRRLFGRMAGALNIRGFAFGHRIGWQARHPKVEGARSVLREIMAGRRLHMSPAVIGDLADCLRVVANIPSQALAGFLHWLDEQGGAGAPGPMPAGGQVAALDAAAEHLVADLSAGPVVFEGRADFILHVRSDGPVRGSLKLENCRRFLIRTEGTLELDRQVFHPKWLFELHACDDFRIDSARIEGARNALAMNRCRGAIIERFQAASSEGYGITLLDCSAIVIRRAVLHRTLAAGIGIFGSSEQIRIERCRITESTGFYNCDAGIHCCNVSPAVGWEDMPERAHEALPIIAKTRRPARILIDRCRIQRCRAQGIYLEGAVLCEIRRNLIADNNKEGICFDWGTVGCHFHGNTVTHNGARRNLSEDEIAADFIQDFPMLADASSSIKLPGIAMDNGCLNLIENNLIGNNYGGGIKLVRASSFNVIVANVLDNNVLGENEYVDVFHGVSCLGVGSQGGEFDGQARSLLDLTPSLMNLVSGNVLSRHHRHIRLHDGRQFFRPSDNVLGPEKGAFIGPGSPAAAPDSRLLDTG